jgi:hypothetical protein
LGSSSRCCASSQASGLLTIANAAWAHAIGVVCFFGFILSGYQAALPADVVDTGQGR